MPFDHPRQDAFGAAVTGRITGTHLTLSVPTDHLTALGCQDAGPQPTTRGALTITPQLISLAITLDHTDKPTAPATTPTTATASVIVRLPTTFPLVRIPQPVHTDDITLRIESQQLAADTAWYQPTITSRPPTATLGNAWLLAALLPNADTIHASLAKHVIADDDLLHAAQANGILCAVLRTYAATVPMPCRPEDVLGNHQRLTATLLSAMRNGPPITSAIIGTHTEHARTIAIQEETEQQERERALALQDDLQRRRAIRHARLSRTAWLATSLIAACALAAGVVFTTTRASTPGDVTTSRPPVFHPAGVHPPN